MNFLNVGPWELTVIIVIAVLLIGPKRMVEVTRAIGRITGQLRRFSNEFVATLQAEVMAAGNDSGSPHKPENIIKSLTEPITSLQSELLSAGRETHQAIENIVEGEEKLLESAQGELEATKADSDTSQKSQDFIKSITEPITSLQSELLAAGRETRQAIENIIEGKADSVKDIQAEVQTTEQGTRQAQEDTINNISGQEA